MNSMPEPTQPDQRINDNPDYRDGYADGYVDCATLTGINEDIVQAAMIALAAFHPETPEQAADMLLFWRRRAELTEADIAEVGDRMFPEPLPLMDCPAWCTTDHSGYRYNRFENLAEHDREVLVERDERGGVKLQVLVSVTDDLTERRRNEPGILIIADEPISPAQAIRLVGAVSEGLRILAA